MDYSPFPMALIEDDGEGSVRVLAVETVLEASLKMGATDKAVRPTPA